MLVFYLGQVARGEFQGFQQEQALTLSDLCTLVLDDAEIRELRDVSHMRFRAEHLQQFFGAETPVESITEAAIARYVAARRKVGNFRRSTASLPSSGKPCAWPENAVSSKTCRTWTGSRNTTSD